MGPLTMSQFSKKLIDGLGDRNGDGRVDHLDVWLTRGVRYLTDPTITRAMPAQRP